MVCCASSPIVAIGLALWTKQTIFSLFIAVWLGSTHDERILILWLALSKLSRTM